MSGAASVAGEIQLPFRRAIPAELVEVADVLEEEGLRISKQTVTVDFQWHHVDPHGTVVETKPSKPTAVPIIYYSVHPDEAVALVRLAKLCEGLPREAKAELIRSRRGGVSPRRGESGGTEP